MNRGPAPVAAAPGRPAVWLRATRPAFVVVTLIAVLLGTAAAAAGAPGVRVFEALLAAVLAALLHAGANVLNDYHDARSGADAGNHDRISPYTGGSRMIQDGLLGVRQTAVLGAVLLAAAVPGGLWLAAAAGPGLFAIGAAGILLGWAYSAPPFALMSRGLGEVTVAACFALVVLGAACVQTGRMEAAALLAAPSYALLVANLLLVNALPDRRPDAAAGKRTLAVRLGPTRAARVYAVVAAAAHVLPVAVVAAGGLPVHALAALASAPFSARAALDVLRMAERPSGLAPAIRATILAAVVHGTAMAAGLALAPGRSG